MIGVHLDLPNETAARLETIHRNAGTFTLGETIGNALRLYEWLLAQQKRGAILLLQEAEGGPIAVITFVWDERPRLLEPEK